MANGKVPLGSIRLQAQQRADRPASSAFITAPEWNQYISNSYKELVDILVQCYGANYFLADPFDFTTVNQQFLYPLPDGYSVTDTNTGLIAKAYYKLDGLELISSPGTPLCPITLDRMPFTDRNKYNLNNQNIVYGTTNLRYCLAGDDIWLAPTPAAGQVLRAWYVPEPINLQSSQVGSISGMGSGVMIVQNTDGLSVGMSVNDNTGASTYLTSTCTIASIDSATQVTVTPAANQVFSGVVVSFWSDSTTLDGISGWEEYVITDVAIKAMQKEESDCSILLAQKQMLTARIEASGQNRDASTPPRVSDTRGLNRFGRNGNWWRY